MKPSTTHFQNKHSILIFGILIVSALLPALLAIKNINISPDSMIYSLMSQELLSGNGLSLPIFFNLKDNYDFINGTVPYVGGPPLLPMLFALLGGVTPQSFLPSQIINLTSHVAISIFTFLLMEKLYDNKGIALLTGTLAAISFPLLWNTHRMITEPLYISLAAAVLYFLTLSRHPDQSQLRNLFIAGVCTSVAVLTRFAGVALIPVFLWGIVISAKNKKLKISTPTILITVLPLITTGALFMRTYIVSGSMHGIPLPSPNRSYLDAFTGTMKMILLQFGLGDRPIKLIAVLAVLFILYIIVNTNMRRELSRHVHSGLDLIFVFIISHTAIITYAMAKSQTVFESRYMSPLVPFLFILCVLAIAVLWEMVRLKGFSTLSLCGIILSLGILFFGNVYKTHINSEALFSKRTGHYRILNSATYNWLKENYGEDVFITTNRPFHLSFFGGYSTIRLPHRRFNKNYRIPDNMESFLPNRMSKFRSRVLVLFEEADEQYEGSYVTGLFNERRDNDSFILIQEFSDGVIYALKE